MTKVNLLPLTSAMKKVYCKADDVVKLPAGDVEKPKTAKKKAAKKPTTKKAVVTKPTVHEAEYNDFKIGDKVKVKVCCDKGFGFISGWGLDKHNRKYYLVSGTSIVRSSCGTCINPIAVTKSQIKKVK